MSLKIYNRKRNFSKTPEPKGKAGKKNAGNLRFVVQMHSATRLHFDLRLEFGGVFRSWAVPKGPSLNPLDQRLAVFVEDHPIEYGSFEGVIPKGNYGAGTVMLWDEGTYVERGSSDRKQSEVAMMKAFEKGHITFVVDGTKLKGEFALIKLKKNAEEKAWLLVKKRDEHSTYKRSKFLSDDSVKTGRTIEQIAEQSTAAGDVWLPKKGKQTALKAKPKTKLKPSPKPNPQPKQATTAAKDPMPRKSKPMLATFSRRALEGDQWLIEPDPQGLRALAEVDGKQVHLYSRSGLPFEKKFPGIVAELKELGCRAVFDGEVVTIREQAQYIVYDILYSGDRDLRKQPLFLRKNELAKILPTGKNVRAIAPLRAKTGRLVAKNIESIYRPGTSADWLIVEAAAVQEVKKPPVKKARAVKISVAAKKSSKKPATPPPIADEPRLTNVDKVFWPNDGITKGDLLNYYKEISPYILPYLKDRPESMNRQPNGIAAPGFYQKDMTGHIPRWLKTVRVYSESADRSIDYVLCQDERSLLYMVNLGCIEINPWLAKAERPDHPVMLTIDLDPDGNSFDHVIEIAHEFKILLKQTGAVGFCKTSGATGIHIGIPLGARYEFDEARLYAEALCRIVAKKYPATTSIERNPNRRRKKIYLDFMQNRRGQTLAAPYCVRPHPKAPVSMPLEWKDLKPGLRPVQFHIANALQIVRSRKLDPWKGVLGKAIVLSRCIKEAQKKLKV
jgi:bifunctional non-homologous end joining protein LigD